MFGADHPVLLQAAVLSCKGGDRDTGRRASSLGECFRVDARGRVIDTQYRLLRRESAYAARDDDAPRRRRTVSRPSYSRSAARSSSRSYYRSSSPGWYSRSSGWSSGCIQLVAEQLRPTLLGRLSFRMFAVNGGLMSYGINAIDQFPRARHVEAKRSCGLEIDHHGAIPLCPI